jgi:redox-sensing transcriptional repressor
MAHKHGKGCRGMPYPVVRRLARYKANLCDTKARDGGWISSDQLAADLGLTSATVRRDISYLGFKGITNRGYDVVPLERTLSTVLGLRKGCDVVIVGAGNMGRALILHGDVARMGFRIRGIFDADRQLLHKKIGNLSVQNMGALAHVVKRYKVAIGIIAVPSTAAQDVANKLVRSGIRGLLNLACTSLNVPDPVFVVEARIAAGLVELCCCVRRGTAL